MVDKNNQVQVSDLNQIQQIGDFGVNELMALKESIAKKLSVPQFNLFMYQMNRMGLDPSLGHGVPILYGQDVNIRIEYEGYKSLAQTSEGYEGIYTQVVCENEAESFEAETDDEGIITKITHKPKLPRGKVIGAYAIAKRDGKKNIVILCDKSEFEKYAKKNPSFWLLEDKSLDPDMCKKFVGTRAAKAQYDIAASVEENMMALNAGNANVESEPTRKDITPEVTKTEAPKSTTKQPTKEPEKPIDITPDPIKAVRDQLNANLKLLGITVKEDKGDWIEKYANFFDPTNPTLDEWEALAKTSEMQLAEKAAEDDKPL